MARTPFNPDLVRVPPDQRPSAPDAPLTVSRVTAMVKRAIETTLPGTIHVVGEISNFKRHSSGHIYLTLKDDASELSCVMWRSAAAGLKFTPTDGLEVVATGRIDVFERAGRYQLYVRKLDPCGIGALELAFRQLRERLAADGLFDQRHKRPLPAYPSCIAVVTSETGAAITDILQTLARRYPCVRILLYPVRVQGPGAAEDVAGAVATINTHAATLGGVDLMIVGRGGGSLEDLWAFNEEVLARAIFASRIPVISAVGHEVDVTIADLVADVRAATPTAAAEIAVPVLDDVLTDLAAIEARITRAAAGCTALSSARFAAVVRRPALADPLAAIHRRELVVDELATRINRSLADRSRALRVRLEHMNRTLQRIAPQAYLLRTAVRLRDAEHRLRWAAAARLRALHRSTDAADKRLAAASPALAIGPLAERVSAIGGRLTMTLAHRLSLFAAIVRSREDVLAAMSYKSVLGRGFSITRRKKGRDVVRSVGQVYDGDTIITQLRDGEFESQVRNLRQWELFDD